MKKPRIALIHDDLVQWGGAERMLHGLSKTFPDAVIFTSVIDRSHPLIDENFNGKKIYTSFIQKIPFWKTFYKQLLPLYPIAFEQFDFSEYDVVISQTTRFAKSVLTKPNTTHICYCHTPPRFLYGYSQEHPPTILKPYFNWLKRYDRVSSVRVDQWVAGSKNAQSRIDQEYKTDSQVIYPFVEMPLETKAFEGGYLLVISRLNAYKRVDLVIKAAKYLNLPLKIVGVGPEIQSLYELAENSKGIEFLGNISDSYLHYVLAGCKALIVAGEEDFGLTPLEAQSFGKPVIAFKKGGALETVIDGQTGYLFEEQSVSSLVDAINRLDQNGYNEKKCKENASKFSQERFTQEFQNLVNSL